MVMPSVNRPALTTGERACILRCFQPPSATAVPTPCVFQPPSPSSGAHLTPGPAAQLHPAPASRLGIPASQYPPSGQQRSPGPLGGDGQPRPRPDAAVRMLVQYQLPGAVGEIVSHTACDVTAPIACALAPSMVQHPSGRCSARHPLRVRAASSRAASDGCTRTRTRSRLRESRNSCIGRSASRRPLVCRDRGPSRLGRRDGEVPCQCRSGEVGCPRPYAGRHRRPRVRIRRSELIPGLARRPCRPRSPRP